MPSADRRALDAATVAERAIELENARQALWDCFKFAGGDTDGDERPHCETKYLVAQAIECVRDLRDEYDALMRLGENDPGRYEIGVLIGPCLLAEAKALMEEVDDLCGQRLGAVVSLTTWNEDDDASA